MRLKTFSGLTLLLLFSVFSVPAVRPQTTAKTKTVRESFAADKERAKASAREQRDENEPPRDGEEWFNRAYKMHNSDRYPEAIEAFKRAIDLGYREDTAMYNIACGYALLNDKENALAWLQRAQQSGFDLSERIADDSDLDPLRTDVRFKKLMEAVPLTAESEHKSKGRLYGTSDRLEEANAEYARLNQEASPRSEEWAKVGAKLLMLRELDLSIVALNRAVSLQTDDASNAMYNLACAYALKGDRSSGIEWLEKAVNGGFDSPQKLSYDPDINSLRSDTHFAAIEKLSNTLSLSQFNVLRNKDNDSDDFTYSKQRWTPAVALYSSFVKTEPNSGRGWFNLGYALHYSREHAKAIDAWEHAIALNYHKGTSTYDVACAYAMLNQRDAAFEALDRAFKLGFGSHGSVNWDHDLDNLRADARFQRFVELAKNNEKSHSKKD